MTQDPMTDDPVAADAQATPPAGGGGSPVDKILARLDRVEARANELLAERDALRGDVERLTAELEEARIDPNDIVTPHRPSPNVVRVRTGNVGIVQARPMIHPDDLEPDPRDAEIDALRSELLAARAWSARWKAWAQDCHSQRLSWRTRAYAAWQRGQAEARASAGGGQGDGGEA